MENQISKRAVKQLSLFPVSLTWKGVKQKPDTEEVRESLESVTQRSSHHAIALPVLKTPLHVSLHKLTAGNLTGRNTA